MLFYVCTYFVFVLLSLFMPLLYSQIILRNRATKNLQMLNTFLKNWNKKQEMFGDDVAASGNQVSKRVPVIG